MRLICLMIFTVLAVFGVANAADHRRDKNAPPGVPDGSFVIDRDPRGTDRLAGVHAFRSESAFLFGRSVEVGCVPCFSAVTNVAVIDGVPYAVNGLTRPKLERYWLVRGGRMLPVRDVEALNRSEPPGLIERVQSVPGCASPAVAEMAQRLLAMSVSGHCLRR